MPLGISGPRRNQSNPVGRSLDPITLVAKRLRSRVDLAQSIVRCQSKSAPASDGGLMLGPYTGMTQPRPHGTAFGQ